MDIFNFILEYLMSTFLPSGGTKVHGRQSFVAASIRHPKSDSESKKELCDNKVRSAQYSPGRKYFLGA